MDAYFDDGREKHILPGGVSVLGRDRRTCNLVFDDELLSRRHAYVLGQPDGTWMIMDINSSNGIQVNGRAIEYVRLHDGDKVELGGLSFTFHCPPPPSDPRVQAGGDPSSSGRLRTSSQEFVRVLRDQTVVLPGVPKSELRSDFDKLLILYKVNRLVTSETDLDTLLKRVVDLAMEVLDADRVSIMFRTKDGLTPRLQRARDREEIERGLQHISQSISEFCLQKLEPVITKDALIDKRFQKSGSIQMYNIRSAMCSPLMNKEEAFGVLYVDNRIHGECFDDDDLRLLEAFADSVAIAIVNSQLISRLRDSYQQVKQQQEALVQGEKLAAMGQLSAGISHEIRGPLTAISGYVQLYFAKYKEDAPFYQRMRRIEESLETINSIVSGLLDLARKGEGRMAPCGVRKILESTLKIAEHSLTKVGTIKVLREFAPRMPEVHGDRRQLQQVFLNMMLNAAQAMPNGGTLTIGAREGPPLPDGQATVEAYFRDTGVGIPDEVKSQLFQPFFTQGKKGGTGLGLSISKNIVDLHAGSILIDSEVGKGTTFVIRLPALGQSSRLGTDARNERPAEDPMADTAPSIPPGGGPETMLDTNPELNVDKVVESAPAGGTPAHGIVISNLTGDPDPGGSETR